MCARDRIQALAYNTRWEVVQALGINNDNYKMGTRVRYTRYGTIFARYDASCWYTIIYKLYKIYKLYRSYLQACIKMQDWLEHQGNKRVLQWMVNGWARDRVVIDNGSV